MIKQIKEVGYILSYRTILSTVTRHLFGACCQAAHIKDICSGFWVCFVLTANELL